MYLVFLIVYCHIATCALVLSPFGRSSEVLPVLEFESSSTYDFSERILDLLYRAHQHTIYTCSFVDAIQSAKIRIFCCGQPYVFTFIFSLFA